MVAFTFLLKLLFKLEDAGTANSEETCGFGLRLQDKLTAVNKSAYVFILWIRIHEDQPMIMV